MNSSSAPETNSWQAQARDSGLEAVGAIAWGTHFCQFYSSKEDLVETLVPYMKAGLDANELCMWVTSEKLNAREAEAVLRQAVPDLDRYLQEKRIEIADCSHWYEAGGSFDANKVVAGWMEKLEIAHKRGFEGLRVTGDVSWLELQGWKDFIGYESDLDSAIESSRVLVLCTYPLDKCGPREIVDAAANHEFALLRSGSRWRLLENTSRRRFQRKYKKFVSLAGNSSEFIGICDLDFVPSYINEAGMRMAGLDDIRQLKNLFVKDFFFPEDQSFVLNELIPRVFAKGHDEVEIRFRHFKTGEPLWMICTVFLMKGDKDEPVGLATISRDITGRKLAEDDAKWNARRSELLSSIAARLLRSGDPQSEVKEICRQVMDFLGCEVFFNFLVDEPAGNLRLNAFWGIPENEARKLERLNCGTGFCGCVARDTRRTSAQGALTLSCDSFQSGLIRSYGTAAYCCHPLMSQDRAIGTLAFSSRRREKFSQPEIEVMAAVTDLVAMAMHRIQTETALRAAEERFHGIYEHALAGIAIGDREGRIERCNPAFSALLGYSEEELRGMHFGSIIHPDDRKAATEKNRRLLSGEADSFVIEHRYLRKDGEPVWVRKIISTLAGKSGKPSQVLAVAIDISEAKRAEAALRESEERLQAIVGTAIDGIVVIDSGGIIQSLNPAAERMFGYTSGEAIGQSIAILSPEPLRLRRHVRPIASANTLAPGFGRVEVEGLRRDGSRFPAELSVASWEAGEKRFYTGILRDITQRKRREEKIEILLREVNHRSKNLLSLVQAIAAQTAATEPAEFMRHFSERLRALAASQDLLVKSHWRGISIEELVKSQLAHFRDLFGERIELEGLPLRIAASAAQSIGMALHELATNAGKYGALSNGAGRVAIVWSLGDDGTGQRRFHLTWTERGGPPVFVPARRGFGSIVVETMPRMELDAEAELDFAPEGLRWRLDCPVETILETNGAVSDLQLLVQ